MITKFRVLRNPNPVHQHVSYVRRYNELLVLRDQKCQELEEVTRLMRECAMLICWNTERLRRFLK